MKRFLLAVAVVMTGFLSFSAHAVLIDFEALKHEDALNVDHGFQYIEDGFQFDEVTANQGLHTFGTLESRFTGSTALFNDTVGGITKLSKFGGGTFDLISIDLAELNGSRIADITFVTDLGHSQTFTIDGVAFGAETFLFDAGFLGVNFVTWTQETPFHQFDNLVIGVPEPSTIALLGLGLLGLGVARRRKVS
jgi:hypothetical protein